MNSFATNQKNSQFVGQAEAHVHNMTDQDLREMLGEAEDASLKAVMTNDIYFRVLVNFKHKVYT